MRVFKIILLMIVLITILLVFNEFACLKNKKNKILRVGETKIFVEVADTPEERERGLSGRKDLKENNGMLFVFEKEGYYAFWMKDMLFALDFIWIRKNEIVEINENVKPENYQPPKTLLPKNKVDAVLEVKAGFVKKNNIKIGEKISGNNN